MASLKQRLMLRFANFWPPFAAAGIHVRWGREMKSAEVSMKMHWWNRNFVGTHYGGSLYSMCDPFYMLMLLANLGPGYVVWDKAASIRFRKPGRGTLRARFEITDATLNDIRAKLEMLPKYEPTYTVEVKDESGAVIAEVQKTLHIRKK